MMAQEYTGEVIAAKEYDGPVHIPPEENEPSFFKELARQVGMTARAGAMGITFPGRLIGDVLGLRSTEAMEGLFSKIGLEPKNAVERVSQDVAGGMAGVGAVSKSAELIMKGGQTVGQNIARVLSERQGMQIASGGAGGGGAGTAREMGGGPVVQTAAGMTAGMAPFAGVGLAGATRAGIRGDRGHFVENVDLYERGIGLTPSVGQASSNLMTEGLESGLSRFPGGNVPMIKLATAEQAALGQKVESMASTIAPPSTKMSVGKMIEEGITGPGGYMERTKAEMRGLYDKLNDRFGRPDYPVPVSNTTRFLDGLASGKPGAENLLKTLQNAKVIDISSALNKDLGGKPGTSITLLNADGQPLSTVTVGGKPAGTTVPFDAWKEIRSRIGELIGDPQLTSDIPRRQLKALYASMSKDIEAAAVARDAELGIVRGVGPTQQAVNRANTVTRLIHDRIDDILQPVMNAGGPENIYNAALRGTKDGDTMFRGVMRALPQEGKDALTADIFRRLGKATGQHQTNEGTAFSTERFLTQWSNLSPEAKRTLTIGLPRSFKNDLDDVTQIAANMREGSSIFKNPSGSGQAIVAAGTAGALATSIVMAPFVGVGPVATAVTTVSATYGAARLFTSPAFVHWLAKATRQPVEAIPAQLNILGQIAASEKDPDRKKAMEDYAAQVRQ